MGTDDRGSITSKMPADLHAHARINLRFPGSGGVYRWEFEKDGKSFEISSRGR
jgi:hypothetical protein